jgi:hypothetical protein
MANHRAQRRALICGNDPFQGWWPRKIGGHQLGPIVAARCPTCDVEPFDRLEAVPVSVT